MATRITDPYSGDGPHAQAPIPVTFPGPKKKKGSKAKASDTSRFEWETQPGGGLSGGSAEQAFIEALEREREAVKGEHSSDLAARGVARGGPAGKRLTGILQEYTTKGAQARANFAMQDLMLNLENRKLELESRRTRDGSGAGGVGNISSLLSQLTGKVGTSQLYGLKGTEYWAALSKYRTDKVNAKERDKYIRDALEDLLGGGDSDYIYR